MNSLHFIIDDCDIVRPYSVCFCFRELFSATFNYCNTVATKKQLADRTETIREFKISSNILGAILQVHNWSGLLAPSTDISVKNNFWPIISVSVKITFLCAVMLGIHHDAELGEVEAVVAVAVVLPEARLHVRRAQPADSRVRFIHVHKVSDTAPYDTAVLWTTFILVSYSIIYAYIGQLLWK